jgi:hypothetical protein
VTAFYVQAGFQRDAPTRVCQLAELADKLAAQTWFTTTKADSTIGGEKIQVIYLDLFQQHFGCQYLTDTTGMVALWIKTITATQRTAVKGYEGGDTVAVNTHAVTVDTYQRRFDMVDTSHFFLLIISYWQ